MREMKDSGIEWIGEIPKDWSLKKGRYLFVQRNDRGNDENLQLLSPSQKFGVIPQSLLEDLTTQTTVKLKENTDLSTLKTVHKGDFCISLRSFQGGFEYSEYEGVVSPAYQVFYKKEDLVNTYYKYIFKDSSFISKMNSYTMSLRDGKNISYFDFGNTYLPLPTVCEQQQIADYLDTQCSEIDATAEDIQKEISLLEDYKKSVITEAVTKGLNHDAEMKDSGIEWIGQIPKHWKVVRLEFLSWVRARLGWKGLKADEYVDEGYPFLSALNIQDSKIKWEPLNFITKERFDESPEIMVACGDVLLLKDGAGVGKCARIDSLPKGDSTVNSSLAVITCFDNLNYRYLYYSFNSSFFSNLINLKLNGMGVPHLTQEELRKFIVLLPCVKEQQQIADFLDTKCSEIDAIIADKKRQRGILAEYKKSLIYEYVTGKKEVPVHE